MADIQGITTSVLQKRKIADNLNILKKTPADKSHRHPKSSYRTAWTIGRDDSMSLSTDNGKTVARNPFMTWWVNPSECQWKIGTRTTLEKVGGGAIHHEWPQSGIGQTFVGSRFDQPTLSISFQSGIITVGGYNDIFPYIHGTKDSSSPPPGLGNFYDFMALLDKPNIQADGSPNYINMMYSSLIFGDQGIWLQGFFSEEGVSWTDSADNPNQITSWGASFIVYNSRPTFNKLRECFTVLGMAGF